MNLLSSSPLFLSSFVVWSGSANDTNNVWNVNSNGNFDNNNYNNDNEAGVRPDSFDTTMRNTRNRLRNKDFGNKIYST